MGTRHSSIVVLLFSAVLISAVMALFCGFQFGLCPSPDLLVIPSSFSNLKTRDTRLSSFLLFSVLRIATRSSLPLSRPFATAESEKRYLSTFNDTAANFHTRTVTIILRTNNRTLMPRSSCSHSIHSPSSILSQNQVL